MANVLAEVRKGFQGLDIAEREDANVAPGQPLRVTGYLVLEVHIGPVSIVAVMLNVYAYIQDANMVVETKAAS